MNQLDYYDTSIEEVEPFPAVRSMKLLKYLVAAALLVLLGAILLFSASNRLAIALMAYLNCVLYSAFSLFFYKKRTVSSLIPIATPMWMIFGSCLGIIYFSIFYPNSVHSTLTGLVSHFAGGVRYQLVIFLLLLSYFLTMALVLRKDTPGTQHPFMCTKRIAVLAFMIFIPVVLLNAVSKVVTFPGPILYLADGLFLYCSSLLFVAGALIKKVSKTMKIVLAAFLAASVLFYTIGNARAAAIKPILALLYGIFLFSELSPKTKAIIFMVCLAVLPTYVVIGNTTRLLLGKSGFEDLAYRWQTLKEWRYVVARQGDFLYRNFGRFFYTGGNVIITSTPSELPYLPFSPVAYGREMVEALVPGVILYRPYYRGNWKLPDYGINVIPGVTSVEVSLIGHLWLLGGYLPVIGGGIVLGLVHGLLAWRMRRNWLRSPDRSVFYFGILFVSFGLASDLISIWRTAIWHLMFAFIAFKLISPFLRLEIKAEDTLSSGYEE